MQSQQQQVLQPQQQQGPQPVLALPALALPPAQQAMSAQVTVQPGGRPPLLHPQAVHPMMQQQFVGLQQQQAAMLQQQQIHLLRQLSSELGPSGGQQQLQLQRPLQTPPLVQDLLPLQAAPAAWQQLAPVMQQSGPSGYMALGQHPRPGGWSFTGAPGMQPPTFGALAAAQQQGAFAPLLRGMQAGGALHTPVQSLSVPGAAAPPTAAGPPGMAPPGGGAGGGRKKAKGKGAKAAPSAQQQGLQPTPAQPHQPHPQHPQHQQQPPSQHQQTQQQAQDGKAGAVARARAALAAGSAHDQKLSSSYAEQVRSAARTAPPGGPVCADCSLMPMCILADV